jgi:selenocysteine-specific elongation factor
VSAPPLTIGTAGHVDHGKTALVRALTGRDTDRLPAERARGLTIEPGFAPCDLPSGLRVSLIDVPGHERFVRHMIAGASGVDAFLLCVAADDGVMPQTREHLDVLGLLGISRGVAAVTRADLADPAPAAAAVRELLGPSVPVIPVCAPSGEGIPALRAALDRLAGDLARRTAAGPARLFIDRVFSVAGAGTVVTGTHWGAPLSPGDRVTVMPGGARGRVRAIQAHDRPVERASGGRVALALAGVDRDQAPRGACVVGEGDGWKETGLLDVALTWLPGAGGPLRTRRRLQAFLGTAEVPAACVLLEAEALGPGESGPVQLRLERPVVARPGDRVVLRSAERRTVGGGVVGDAHPPRRGRRAARPATPRPAPVATAPPARPAPPPGLAAAAAGLLAQAGLRPPGVGELAPALSVTEAECLAALAEARASGDVVEAGGLWFAAAAVAGARATATATLAAGPQTLSALRDAWGCGRRHALALAGHLDATGVTRRVGEARVLRRGARPADAPSLQIDDKPGVSPPG